jgi:hypothetical protein
MDEEGRDAMEERRKSCPCAHPIKPHTMTCGMSGYIDPGIFDLSTSWR